MKVFLAIVGYAAIASVSAWGFPWNLPGVLLGAAFLATLLARGKQ